MKKIVLIIMLITAGISHAQKSSKKEAVPTAVTEAFKKEFPGKKAKWENEKNGYEAEFKINGIEASANYDSTGHRTEMETAIEPKDLPVNAQEYLKKHSMGKVSEAAKIVDDKNNVTYEAEVTQSGKKTDILFDSKGNFLK